VGSVAAALVLAVGAFVVFGRGDDGANTAGDDPVTSQEVDAATAPVTGEPVETDPVVTDPAPETTAPADDTASPVDEVIDDAAVQQAVTAVVDPNIGVVVTNGVALLTGRTDAATADASAAAARGVSGVAEVQDAVLRLQDEELCTDAIQAQGRWVCITNVEFDGTTLFASFDFEFNDGDANLNADGGYHLHFFNGDVDDPIDAGTPNGGASNGTGNWEIWDDPSGYSTDPIAIFNGVVPSQLCVEVANPTHSIENLESGNCFPVTVVENLSKPEVEAQVQVRRRVAGDEYVCTIG